MAIDSEEGNGKMSRPKLPVEGQIKSIRVSLHNDTPLGKLPVLEAVTDDGREIHITFEFPHHIDRHSPTTREQYIARMRTLAASLEAQAERLEMHGK